MDGKLHNNRSSGRGYRQRTVAGTYEACGIQRWWHRMSCVRIRLVRLPYNSGTQLQWRPLGYQSHQYDTCDILSLGVFVIH